MRNPDLPDTTGDPRRFFVGHERRVTIRYLLLGTGVSLFVFGLTFVGYVFGGPQVLFSGVVATSLLVVLTALLSAFHARENDGLLVSILLAFLPTLAEREFDIIFEVGHPQPAEGVLYGVWLALLSAIPVGVVGLVIGRSV